jgi:serine/threonine protein kinase
MGISLSDGCDDRRGVEAMIFEESQALKKRINEVTRRDVPGSVNIFKDTSAFMSIETGDVLRLAHNDYLVTGQAREGRFGIDDQPKFWVKTAIDLTTGSKKIIKLVFHETFNNRIGATVYRCTRSPEKESAVLQKMHGHPNFMQGRAVRDVSGNLVRIIDFISGASLYEYLRRLKISHAAYYRQTFSEVMPRLTACFEAIAHLHRQGLHHGDIRADHIVINSQTDTYVWIDFDYEVSSASYDVFCLGNVLLQAVGKGRHSLEDIRLRPIDYPDVINSLTSSDMSLMFGHRVANLRKLFPYISAELNEILMRFSNGALDPYDNVGSLLADLRLVFPTG